MEPLAQKGMVAGLATEMVVCEKGLQVEAFVVPHIEEKFEYIGIVVP